MSDQDEVVVPRDQDYVQVTVDGTTTVWECQLCSALTLDWQHHQVWHLDTD